MSLRQWFADKFSFFKRKNNKAVDGNSKTDTICYTQTPELSAQSLRDHAVIIILACVLAFGFIPFMYWIPRLYDFATATTWVVTEDFDTSGTVGRFGDVALNSSNLPRTVYYDFTNSKIKYAERASGGTWTVEDIEDAANEFNFGAVENIKFAIEMDPTDSKPSAVYCKYDSDVNAYLRYAHRVGGGAGNCGTSNNWSCQTIDTIESCGSRMIGFAFHATSSQPTVSYINSGRVKFVEYDGTTWTTSFASGFNGGLKYDYHQTALTYTTSSEPIIFYRGSNDVSTNYLYQTYRKASDWTWQTAVEIDSEPFTPGGQIIRSVDVIRDSSGYFYVSYNHFLHGLKHAKVTGVVGLTGVTTSTVDSTVSSTWNSIALTSGGNSRIAYYDTSNSDLRYASYSGASWSTETASSTGDVGKYVALRLLSNEPVMSYYDVTNANASLITGVAFNSAPTAPTTLYSNSSTAQSGQSNPTSLATGTPAFSALFQDGDTGDTASKAQLQVTTSTDGFTTVTHWDSGSSGNSISSVAINARSSDLIYNNFGTAATKSIGIADDGVEGSNTTYYWRMRFWDSSAVAGDWSATNTFSILDGPAAPTGLTVLLGATSSTSSWTDNSSIEDSFNVAYSTDNVTYSHLASSTANVVTTSTLSSLSANTLYYFKVRAFNTAGYSTYTTATSGYTLANVPVSLTASSTAYDRVGLMWGVNSNPAGTEYYALNVTAGTNSGWITNPNTIFTGLEGAKSYTFQVRARNGGQVATEYTSVVATTTLPNTPSGLVVSQGGNSAVVVWDANGNSSSATYIVENITTGAVSAAQAGLSYTFTGLTLGQTYQFRVKALNSDSISSSYTSNASITLANSAGGASSQALIEQQQLAIEAAKDSITALFEVGGGATSGYTSSTLVVLHTRYSDNVEFMMVSNDPGFDNGVWVIAQPTIEWSIVGGSGVRTVYMKFKSIKGKVSDVYADSIILDTHAPDKASITLPSSHAQITKEQPTYAGFAEIGTTVELLVVDEQTNETIAEYIAATDSSGAWSFLQNVPLITGKYLVYATVVDRAGNKSEQSRVGFSIVDITIPKNPTVDFPIADSIVVVSKFVTHGFAEPRSKIIIVRDKILTHETITSDRGEWSLKFDVPFGSGSHQLEYMALDQSRNQSQTVTVQFMVEATAEEPETELERESELPVVLPIQPTRPQPPQLKLSNIPSPSSAPTSPAIKSIVGPTDVASPTSGEIIPSPAVNSQNEIDAEQAIAFPDASTIVLETVTAAFKDVSAKIVRGVVTARKIAAKPEVQAANTYAVVPTTAMVAIASVGGVVNSTQMVVYLKFLFTQPFALMLRRRRKGWGVVYNAISKMPVDLAVVRLVDAQKGRVVQSRVTDRLGRYQFFAQPGQYTVEITKPEFTFPPAYMKGRSEDGKYTDLYTGGSVTVEAATALRYNLPTDPIGVSQPTSQVLKDAAKKHVAQIASLSGVIMTGVSFVVTPTPLVAAFLVGHIGSYFVFRRLAIAHKPQSWGIIADAHTHEPLAHAVVRIFDTQYNKLLETQVTDSKGRYAFLVGKNTYYVMVEHAGHEKVTSQPIAITNEQEGGVVGFDIALKQEAHEITIAAAVPEQPQTQPIVETTVAYVPKIQLPEQPVRPPGFVRALLRDVAQTQEHKTDDTEQIAQSLTPTQHHEVATFTKVDGVMGARFIRTSPVVITNSKLLAPVTFGSRDLVISGFPSDIDELPEIISDGNFLNAIRK